MDKTEWRAELARLFPLEIMGYKRPTEPMPTDLDFDTYFPQFISKDPALWEAWNAFLRQLLSNDSALKLLVEAIQNQLANCDLRVVTEVLKGLMSPDMLKKLNGIQAGALNNPHPATHPATMITQDATHRFATDAEKTTWNSKANASHGNHVPTTETANNARFLRNDATWQAVTPANIGAAASSHTHDDRYFTEAEVNTKLSAKANTSHGNHVPATQSANNAVFLRNDNNWASVTPGNIGAAATSHTHDDRYYTEAEMNTKLNAKANLNSPGLTGTPTAPTAAAATNNTQIATTAFVKAAITSGGGGIVAASLAQNGYVKFSNGLILQWGADISTDSSVIDKSFPILFPQKCFSMICTNSDNQGSAGPANISVYNKSGYSVHVKAGNYTWSEKYLWAALGI